jgi:steroid delta-isomerase-like uncharacterized protein
MAALSKERMAARLKLVEEHVRLENSRDLDGIMATFGAGARYDDEPWDLHYAGRDEVRSFYEGLLQALPDLRIDVLHNHASDTAIVLEVTIRGRHVGHWRGLPPTGSPVSFPLCGIFTFDGDDRLAGERIYYDRATVLGQLGVLHDPQSVLGRVSTALLHPVTMAKVVARLFRKN